MKPIVKTLLLLVVALTVMVIALTQWISGLAQDTGGSGRPAYGAYTWPAHETVADDTATDSAQFRPLPQTPRGGTVPRADGYVMGSLGNDFILPPMPPERSTDIARKDNVFKNNAIQSCFWPGPKLRPGFYTTDPDDYGVENQLPDTGNTFSTAWFRIPAGAKIVVKGEFPHMRHWSFVTYTEKA